MAKGQGQWQSAPSGLRFEQLKSYKNREQRDDANKVYRIPVSCRVMKGNDAFIAKDLFYKEDYQGASSAKKVTTDDAGFLSFIFKGTMEDSAKEINLEIFSRDVSGIGSLTISIPALAPQQQPVSAPAQPAASAVAQTCASTPQPPCPPPPATCRCRNRLCGEEMPQGTRICPHCGWNQANNREGVWFWIYFFLRLMWRLFSRLSPDDSITKRIVEWAVVGLTIIVSTAALSAVCGYSVVWTWQYWIGLLAVAGLFTIMWLRKKTSMDGPYLALKVAAVVMVVSLLILAVWPKANIKNAAFAVKHPEYRKYDKGEYKLGLAEGRMSGWILPDGVNFYDIKSTDNQFMLITTGGAKIPSWDKANWPKNSPFQIYAVTNQDSITLILK